MSRPSQTNQAVVKAVVVTAATTLVIVGIIFLFFKIFAKCRQKNKIDTNFCREEAKVTHEEYTKFGGKVKGLIVDENGQDVLYMRRLEDGELKTTLRVMCNPSYEEADGEEKRMYVTSERLKKSKSWKLQLLHEPPDVISAEKEQELVVKQKSTVALQANATLQPAPPAKKFSPPPSPPPPPPPLLPPILVKKNLTPPPPPKAGGGLVSSFKPPLVPRGTADTKSGAGTSTENLKGTGSGQMKLKPLHWDKVIATADHSMVWNDINDGSLRFDDDLIETLFGYTSKNNKSTGNNISSASGSSNPASRAQVFILEPRKSQNTAIILRSLAASRKEILDALLEGHGLSADTLEKLIKIAPTQEEEAKILQFNDKPTQLADAESFLYHILKAIPCAFIRVNAMLFRSSYNSEILQLKEYLETLKLGCKELRTRGLFLKLLEAILKAGNKMNAGTSRGNAKGFNLSALQKLSDVKSTDGKTTLLHFVVEQVVRSEGRRCVINRNYSLGRSNSQRSKYSDISSTSLTEEEREKEYLMLGLPALGGLSTEFSNVKKAATIEYDSFTNMCSSLTARVAEIRQLVTRCGNNEKKVGFMKEMKAFLEECEEDLKMVREEQTRVMELVKRTTEYYQAGASKEKGAYPLQLFVIVKDFLYMVDRNCVDITRKLQRNVNTSVGSSPRLLPQTRAPMKLQNYRSLFMPDMSRTTSSSESDDDF